MLKALCSTRGNIKKFTKQIDVVFFPVVNWCSSVFVFHTER